MIISGLRFIFRTSMAAKGEAITPPITSPMITCQLDMPVNIRKVAALEREMKNSAALTEPMV